MCDAACWRPEGRAAPRATIHPQTHDAFRELYGAVKSSFYGGRKSILMTSTYLPAACPLTRAAECRTQRALPDRNLILGHHNKSRRSCGSSLRSLAFLRGSALRCCNKSVGNVYSFTVGSFFFFFLSCSAGGVLLHTWDFSIFKTEGERREVKKERKVTNRNESKHLHLKATRWQCTTSAFTSDRYHDRY